MSTQFIPASDDFELLLKQAIDPQLNVEINAEFNARLRAEISAALDTVEDPGLFELLRMTFDEVLRIFNRLSLIERKLNELDTLQENLSILELLQFEIRYFIDFIHDTAMKN